MANINETLALPIEIEQTTQSQRSVIWLHGLGADGSDFVPIVSELHLPPTLGIRFIFPHAPIMPITLNNGYEMRAWFDIAALNFESKIDEAGIAKSVKSVTTLIEKEMARGIAAENIILAGFSQGAVVALSTGLTYPQRLGGIMALSGFLPLATALLNHASPANRDIPIFIAHGKQDTIVPFALGKATYQILQQAGYSLSWHSYDMPHSVCAAEVQDISKWIQTVYA